MLVVDKAVGLMQLHAMLSAPAFITSVVLFQARWGARVTIKLAMKPMRIPVAFFSKEVAVMSGGL